MEDSFDRSVRERLEKAALDPSPDVWDRINSNIAPPGKGYPVWVKLAAGLLVAGVAAGYFMQHEQSPQQVASVMMAVPEEVAGPVEEKIQETVQPSPTITRDFHAEAAPSQQETVAMDEAPESEYQEPTAVETVSMESAAFNYEVESTGNEGFQTLVFELPVEIAQAPGTVNATTERRIHRFTRLIREVKNGEVSLGQLREYKDGLFTRSFWKGKLSKNANQIMQ